MTGTDGSYPGWGAPPPGGQPPQYNQPYYPQQYPPQYPQQPPQYPPQPYYPPPPAYQQPYPPQQPYGQPQAPYPPGQYQPPPQQPIVLPIEGKGAAKLAAKLNRRSLIISPEGFGHDGKQGAFRVGWSELQRITITTAYHRATGQLIAPKTWRVRVIMDAADPSFVQRHPEIAGLQGKYGGSGAGSFGLPLGPVENMVQQLAQALATYGGQVFGGVIEEGQVIGFHYL
jgi:hypothetical protein